MVVVEVFRVVGVDPGGTELADHPLDELYQLKVRNGVELYVGKVSENRVRQPQDRLRLAHVLVQPLDLRAIASCPPPGRKGCS